MKITKVDCTPYAIGLKTEMTYAGGTLAKLEHVLVEVHTDEGLAGIGEALARPGIYGETQRGIVAAIGGLFAPMIVGLDPFAIEQVWARLSRIANNNSAKSALDMALYDIIGKACGRSVRQLLGAYTSSLKVSYVTGFGAPETVAAKAVEINASHGINAFKLKTGLGPVKDIAIVRAVREALPDCQLSIDSNETYTGQEALVVGAAARDLGVAWAEEPVSVGDRLGRRMFADSGLLPVLGDDFCRTPVEAARELGEGMAHLVSIKVARTGFTLSRQIHGLCTSLNARMVMGTQGDSGVGTAVAWNFGAAHRLTSLEPGELSFGLDMDGDIVEESPQIRNGELTYPDRPGIGVTIDRKRLAALAS